MGKKTKVITFGEILLRLSPAHYQRLVQANELDVNYGGAEANVAVSLANLGLPASFVTRLPDNDLGKAAEQAVRKHNVDTNYITKGGDRLGIYFLEKGIGQRGANVTYDRANSSLATINKGQIEWEKIFGDATHFFFTGITPAVSQQAADVCFEALKAAHKAGITIIGDLNYRGKLWKYGKKPGEVMEKMLPYFHGLMGGIDAFEIYFDITPDRTGSIKNVVLEDQDLKSIFKKTIEKFPNIQWIAAPLRWMHSASHHQLSGVLYKNDQIYKAPMWDIPEMIDRVGGGDAFAAGMIYGMINFNEEWNKVIEFAVAASCLKHSIHGDFNLTGLNEIESLIKGKGSGQVAR